jgi:hypothetical protein
VCRVGLLRRRVRGRLVCNQSFPCLMDPEPPGDPGKLVNCKMQRHYKHAAYWK